ncbi:MAG: hypothetical protein R3F59_12030 [Myxococcota bacterium]
MRNLWRWLLPLPALACQTGNGPDAVQGDSTPVDCEAGQTYPDDPTEPMTLGETLSPYRWAEAVHRGTGERRALDLGKVPCATDPEIDWSPFDKLLFVSIPAW